MKSNTIGTQCEFATEVVTRDVERIVEKPVIEIKYVDKIIEKPVVTEKIVVVEKPVKVEVKTI